MRYFEPRLRIRGNDIVTFGQLTEGVWREKKEKDKEPEEQEQRPYSLFALKSRKRLKNTLSNYIDTITLAKSILKDHTLPRLNAHTFATLTLPSPQRHCDKKIKRDCFDPFLKELKKEYNVRHYIWKAEPQKNGNIHFHLLIGHYIDAIELRLIWLYHINKLQYVNEFQRVHKSFLPNATDIHALRKIRNVTAYIGKYMSKNEVGRAICGHTWGRSDSMNKLVSYTFTVENDLAQWHQQVSDSIPNWNLRGDLWQFQRFETKLNIASLPACTMKKLKELITHNISFLTGT